MSFSASNILSIIVIFQLLLLSLFLLTHKKGKRVSNVLLGSFFLSLCFNFTDGILLINNAYVSHPAMAFIGNNFSLLFGPLLYLYTSSVIYKHFTLQTKMLVHAIPFFLFVLFAFFTYHLQSDAMKRYILLSAGRQNIPVAVYVIGTLLYVQFYAYALTALLILKKYRSQINNRFSDITAINLQWLQSTLVLFMIVIGVSFVNSFIPLTPLIHYFNVVLLVIIFSVFLFINRIVLKALRQPQIFEGIQEENEDLFLPQKSLPVALPTVVLKPVRQTTSIINDEEKETLKEKLLFYMEKEKPYLEPQLMLDELADMLKVKPKLLSQVINENLGQNFFDFINRYRIEEAKRLLHYPANKKTTVLEVLYQVGFNSKSSFNTLFKKYTGVTPSEFKKSNAGL